MKCRSCETPCSEAGHRLSLPSKRSDRLAYTCLRCQADLYQLICECCDTPLGDVVAEPIAPPAPRPKPEPPSPAPKKPTKGGKVR